MFPSRALLSALFIVIVPFALTGQSLIPPPQDFFLGFRPDGVAPTTQINLGTSFTMECWISLYGASPSAVIMGKTNNPRGSDPFMHYAIGLDPTGRKPQFAQSTGQPGKGLYITGFDLPLNTWIHLAAVLDSGTMRLYVNGQQVATGVSPGPPATTAVPFTLGGGLPDGQNACCSVAGAMREARVWSRALSPSELRTYATQKLTGTEAGLIADWPLAEGTGKVARDAGPQSLSLALQGGADWIPAALYDAGPYWDYQALTASDGASGGGFGTIVTIGSAVTALLAFQRSTTAAGPTRAFHWSSSGMVDVTANVLPDANSEVHHPRDLAVADFSGDGRLDVFEAGHGIDLPPWYGGQSHILIQSADGKFVDETATRIPIIDAFTHSVTVADIDGDGDIDIYMGNVANSNVNEPGPQLYINDGTGHFTATTAGLPDFVWKLTQKYSSSRFVDVNNDGFPDLVLGNQGSAFASTNNNFVLLNDGHGNFTPAAANTLPPKIGGATWDTVSIAPADYDGDGFTDLMLSMTDHYHGAVALQLLINNGDGTFHDASSQVPAPPTGPPTVGETGGFISGVAPCDINGDGWIDFVTMGVRTAPRLYINQGHGVFTDVSELLPAGASQVLAADFDGDGKIDLFFVNRIGSYGFARNLKPILPTSVLAPGVSNPSLVIKGGQAFAAGGGSGTINITAPQAYSWTVSGAPDWVTFSGAVSRTGNGSVNYQVMPSVGAARSATITVAGLTFTIEQQAATIPGLATVGSMAHIAAEENWTTAFTLVNKSAAIVQSRLSLFGDSSGLLTLPLTFPQQPPAPGPLLAASFDRTLASNASLIVNTSGRLTPPVLTGSSQLAATGSVDGFAIFHQNVTGQEAVVPLETRNASSYLLAFDNTGGLVLGVAVQNVSSQNAVIGLVTRDENGVQMATASMPISANGHASFVLSLQYPVTADKRGTIEFDTPPNGRISVLGLRFTPPNNALTTIPALADVGTNGGSIGHLASGGDGWQTTFVLVNAGSTAAQATLSFFADVSGAPLLLPLSFPQSGSGTATVDSTVTRVLPAGATLTVQSTGAPDLLTGSAQLTTTGHVSGFVIFRHNNQEAVVPLESRNADGYLIAFDNTNGTATGIAVNAVSSVQVNVPVTVRNDSGMPIASGLITLAANGHSAFTLGVDKFPEAAGIRGTIDFDKPANAQIGALGIRIPTGASHTFTTLPALAK